MVGKVFNLVFGPRYLGFGVLPRNWTSGSFLTSSITIVHIQRSCFLIGKQSTESCFPNNVLKYKIRKIHQKKKVYTFKNMQLSRCWKDSTVERVFTIQVDNPDLIPGCQNLLGVIPQYKARSSTEDHQACPQTKQNKTRWYYFNITKIIKR